MKTLFRSILLLSALSLAIPGFVLADSKKAAKKEAKTAPAGPVDLNNATQSELEALNGVGPATAKKIIAGRPYGSVSDLSKAGVSAATIAKITPMVMAGKAAAAPAAKVPAAPAAAPPAATPTAAPAAAGAASAAKTKVTQPTAANTTACATNMVWANLATAPPKKAPRRRSSRLSYTNKVRPGRRPSHQGLGRLFHFEEVSLSYSVPDSVLQS